MASRKEEGKEVKGLKIAIIFPKLAKMKSTRARKPIELSDTVKKQMKDDAKKAGKAVPKKKKSTPKKGKKK